jgi:hypothetical protein
MKLNEVYRQGSELWHFILESVGIQKDPEHERLVFREPKPSFLQNYNPNSILEKISRNRRKKLTHLVVSIEESGETQRKQGNDDSELGGLNKPSAARGSSYGKSNNPNFRLQKRSLHTASTSIITRPQIFPEKKPEGGVVINDTLALNEAKDSAGWVGFEPHPIERKINLKNHKGSNHLTTCNFFTKELQGEHLRLGLHPEEVKRTVGVHPIYRFVPNHLDKDPTYEAEMQMRKTQSMVIPVTSGTNEDGSDD